jgi:hypothetical protein
MLRPLHVAAAQPPVFSSSHGMARCAALQSANTVRDGSLHVATAAAARRGDTRTGSASRAAIVVARGMLDRWRMRAMHGALHLVPARGGTPRGRKPSRLAPTSLAVALCAALLAFASSSASGRRALRALPPDERQAVLSRSVDELRQFCGAARPEALEDHCRELAAFAAQFDECRGDCEALARRQLAPTPTR